MKMRLKGMKNSKGKLSHKDALEALQLTVQYIEQQGGMNITSGIDVMFMRKWCEKIFKNSLKTMRQKTTIDF